MFSAAVADAYRLANQPIPPSVQALLSPLNEPWRLMFPPVPARDILVTMLVCYGFDVERLCGVEAYRLTGGCGAALAELVTQLQERGKPGMLERGSPDIGISMRNVPSPGDRSVRLSGPDMSFMVARAIDAGLAVKCSSVGVVEVRGEGRQVHQWLAQHSGMSRDDLARSGWDLAEFEQKPEPETAPEPAAERVLRALAEGTLRVEDRGVVQALEKFVQKLEDKAPAKPAEQGILQVEIVGMPARVTSTEIEREAKTGEIKKTTQTERDE